MGAVEAGQHPVERRRADLAGHGLVEEGPAQIGGLGVEPVPQNIDLLAGCRPHRLAAFHPAQPGRVAGPGAGAGLGCHHVERPRGEVAGGALGQHEILPAGQAHTVAEPAMDGLVHMHLGVCQAGTADMPARVVFDTAKGAVAPSHRHRAGGATETVGAERALQPLERRLQVHGALLHRHQTVLGSKKPLRTACGAGCTCFGAADSFDLV